MTTSAYIMLIGGITFLMFAVACGEACAARLAKLAIKRPFWNWAAVYQALWQPASTTLDHPDATAARRHFWQMLFCTAGLLLALSVGIVVRASGH
jgi:hypothetical protein